MIGIFSLMDKDWNISIDRLSRFFLHCKESVQTASSQLAVRFPQSGVCVCARVRILGSKIS